MRTLLTWFLILIAFTAKAQVKVFDKYPFENTGYSLLAVRNELWPNKIQQQLGDFYTDDINVLKELKKTWVFTNMKTLPGHKQDHFYHYHISILYKGQEKEHIAINLEEGIIATDYGSFAFDVSKLRPFYGRVKKVEIKEQAFGSAKQANQFMAKAKRSPKYITAEKWDWKNYEGSFYFNYKSKESPDKVLQELNRFISSSYPKESFKLDYRMLGPQGEMAFTVECNKTLYDKFKWNNGSWTYHQFPVISYWKN